ncbi:MAG TPA: isochorismate synthase [Egibacteraceae bacterium]|nr:isochorismate synthase [Egibacteraceae bacterium]
MSGPARRAGTDGLTARTVAVADPRDLLARLPDDACLAWVRHGEGLVGWGQAARLDAGTGPERFARAAAWLSDLFAGAAVHDEVGGAGTGPVAFGSFTFDARAGGSLVVVPGITLGRRGGRAWVTAVGGADLSIPAVGPVQALPACGRIRYAGASISELRWLDAVDDTAEAVRRGELAKAVLARDLRVWSEAELDVRVLARRLAERFPECYTFVCEGLVGATPELLVRRRGRRVESVVLAGSAPRGRGGEDHRLGAALLGSRKDRAEHELAVASVREVLAPACTELAVDGPRLLRLANVQHLCTSVRGTLIGSPTALELVAALHPTAAVCGTPTGRALARIRALEGMDRGRYSGPVGWMDARGDGEWGIALRCAEVAGTRARLFAGAGVVGDSLPEAELEETRLKLHAMQSALEGWEAARRRPAPAAGARRAPT